MMRVFTGNKSFEGIFDHRAGDIARYRNAVTLANAFDAIVGGNLDDNPERTPDTALISFSIMRFSAAGKPRLSYSNQIFFET
jgi:hypothetical protein